ncbi:MAG: sulfite exporter TauE/SafE family protein [Hyphomicrobiaceae bacterium]|nr:sulfite exporter TauE/SafE family protein [Hyphomicrobiaceae bacterium]
MLTLTLALVAATFLLAGFVKGVIGLGLPTIAMGLLALTMPAAQAAAILVVPSIVTNFWQMLDGPGMRLILRRLWPMLAGICLGTWAAAGMLTGAPSRLTQGLLGAAIAVYGGLGLAAVRFSVPPGLERWLSLPMGLATGALGAGTGVFVIPSVPYLSALGLSRDLLVQALAVSFTVSTLALAGNLLAGKAFTLEIAGVSLIALLPALAGMALGQAARTRLSEQGFRRVFFAGLVALGGYIVVRAAR